MNRALVVLVVCLVPRLVHADDKVNLAAMNALFKAQTDSFKSSDEDKFKRTVTADALVSWSGGDYPRSDYSSWNVVTADKVKIVSSKSAWSGSFGWVAADLEITYTWYAEPEGAGDPNPKPETHGYHYVGVFVLDGKTVKAKVVHMVATKSDKDLTAYNTTQTQPLLASPSANVALLTQPKELAARMSADAATTVFGTSDADKAHGGTAAKKLVGRWAKLTLQVLDTDSKNKNDKIFYTPVEVSVGDATVVWARLRMQFAGKKDWYPLDGFAVLRKVGDKSEIVALQFGSD